MKKFLFLLVLVFNLCFSAAKKTDLAIDVVATDKEAQNYGFDNLESFKQIIDSYNKNLTLNELSDLQKQAGKSQKYGKSLVSESYKNLQDYIVSRLLNPDTSPSGFERVKNTMANAGYNQDALGVLDWLNDKKTATNLGYDDSPSGLRKWKQDLKSAQDLGYDIKSAEGLAKLLENAKAAGIAGSNSSDIISQWNESLTSAKAAGLSASNDVELVQAWKKDLQEAKESEIDLGNDIASVKQWENTKIALKENGYSADVSGLKKWLQDYSNAKADGYDIETPEGFAKWKAIMEEVKKAGFSSLSDFNKVLNEAKAAGIIEGSNLDILEEWKKTKSFLDGAGYSPDLSGAKQFEQDELELKSLGYDLNTVEGQKKWDEVLNEFGLHVDSLANQAASVKEWENLKQTLQKAGYASDSNGLKAYEKDMDFVKSAGYDISTSEGKQKWEKQLEDVKKFGFTSVNLAGDIVSFKKWQEATKAGFTSAQELKDANEAGFDNGQQWRDALKEARDAQVVGKNDLDTVKQWQQEKEFLKSGGYTPDLEGKSKFEQDEKELKALGYDIDTPEGQEKWKTVLNDLKAMGLVVDTASNNVANVKEWESLKKDLQEAGYAPNSDGMRQLKQDFDFAAKNGYDLDTSDGRKAWKEAVQDAKVAGFTEGSYADVIKQRQEATKAGFTSAQESEQAKVAGFDNVKEWSAANILGLDIAKDFKNTEGGKAILNMSSDDLAKIKQFLENSNKIMSDFVDIMQSADLKVNKDIIDLRNNINSKSTEVKNIISNIDQFVLEASPQVRDFLNSKEGLGLNALRDFNDALVDLKKYTQPATILEKIKSAFDKLGDRIRISLGIKTKLEKLIDKFTEKINQNKASDEARRSSVSKEDQPDLYNNIGKYSENANVLSGQAGAARAQNGALVHTTEVSGEFYEGKQVYEDSATGERYTLDDEGNKTPVTKDALSTGSKVEQTHTTSDTGVDVTKAPDPVVAVAFHPE